VIKRTDIFNYLFSLIILFPVIFSFVFKIIGLPIPSYLFIIVISFIILFFIANDLLIISKNKLKLVFYLFFIWVLSSIVYTPSVIASKIKCIDILYNTIFPVVIIELFFLSSKQKVIELKSFETQLLRYSYILLWFSLIAFILFKQPEVSGRYTLPGVDNAIWFSRFIGMLVLIILCNSRLNMSNLSKFLLTVTIGFLLLFAGGSRGPVLSVLIVFFIKQSYFISKKNLLLLVIGIISFVAIGFIFIGGYLFETDFYSIYARFDLFNALSDFDFQYMKGSGIGSFALLISGEDITYYPHNIFLEIFFENGLIGVFLFSLMLYLFFRSFKPNIINLLCVYYLIASLVSGDIPGNNNFFILLYVSIYANQNYQLKKKLSLVNQ
jgi:hypothetical protein